MTSTAQTNITEDLRDVAPYVTSGQKIGYETYCWGQPPAAHYVLTVTDRFVMGSDRGVYVTSGAGYHQADLTLEDELEMWAAASDAAFYCTGLDL